MPFKNFKSPTIFEPVNIFYDNLLECLLYIQENHKELYQKLNTGPQFEYDIHSYFSNKKAAKEFSNQLSAILRDYRFESNAIELPTELMGRTIKLQSLLLWQ